MLSSIHPLGERARSNRWSVTVIAFAVGAIAAGALLGWLAAVVGSIVFDAPPPMWWIVLAVGLAGTADLVGIRAPGPHRQVNERWIGTFRGWVYGLGFGAQLGIGFSTLVVTWALPALVTTLAMIGDAGVGIAVGALFGLGRTIPLLANGWIDRPSRLDRFHRGMARLARPAHLGIGIGLIALAGLMAITGFVGTITA
jgi:hypothetical protein